MGHGCWVEGEHVGRALASSLEDRLRGYGFHHATWTAMGSSCKNAWALDEVKIARGQWYIGLIKFDL